MEDAVHAIMMAFAVFVFVIGLTLAIYMFSQITTTSEALLYYADETNFYDNIKIEGDNKTDRVVDAETIIPTLYRYYKENFCVKICDANGVLLQVFDLNLEGKVRTTASTDVRRRTPEEQALNTRYNDKNKIEYLFEAPWIGNTDRDTKTRIDFYINGQSGYINNSYLNYENNPFYKIRIYNQNYWLSEEQKIHFTEKFINYSYSGETMTTDDGDTLVTGTKDKDKIVIIYTADKKLSDINNL